MLTVISGTGVVLLTQVTKHAGSVQKGFSLIVGILVTAVVQVNVENSKLTQVCAISNTLTFYTRHRMVSSELVSVYLLSLSVFILVGCVFLCS